MDVENECVSEGKCVCVFVCATDWWIDCLQSVFMLCVLVCQQHSDSWSLEVTGMSIGLKQWFSMHHVCLSGAYFSHIE